MSKETFKLFAKNHKELAQAVIKGETSWQKLYELYEIYGESSPIWNTYKKSSPFNDIFTTIKNLDINKIEESVTNLQKTISMFQNIGINNKGKKESQEKPMYKYFED